MQTFIIIPAKTNHMRGLDRTSKSNVVLKGGEIWPWSRPRGRAKSKILLPHLKNVIELAKSDILNDGKKTIVPEVSERASRPLISEKSPEVRKEVIKQKAKY